MFLAMAGQAAMMPDTGDCLQHARGQSRDHPVDRRLVDPAPAVDDLAAGGGNLPRGTAKGNQAVLEPAAQDFGAPGPRCGCSVHGHQRLPLVRGTDGRLG